MMVRHPVRSIVASALIAIACAWPLAARAEGPYTNSATAAGENDTQAFCFDDASGQSLCAFSELCEGLTPCTRDADCGAGMACLVNTCCDDPSPNVCVRPASGFTCPAQGPFTCNANGEPFFPPCVPVGLAPTLSPSPLAVGMVVLLGVGLLGLRSRRARWR